MRLEQAISRRLASSYAKPDTDAKAIMELIERFLHHNISDYISPKHMTEKLHEGELP